MTATRSILVQNRFRGGMSAITLQALSNSIMECQRGIDEIEAVTGLDFLSALEADVQNQIESKTQTQIRFSYLA